VSPLRTEGETREGNPNFKCVVYFNNRALILFKFNCCRVYSVRLPAAVPITGVTARGQCFGAVPCFVPLSFGSRFVGATWQHSSPRPSPPGVRAEGISTNRRISKTGKFRRCTWKKYDDFADSDARLLTSLNANAVNSQSKSQKLVSPLHFRNIR